jgi:nitric oxide reductase subunit B
MRAIGDTIFAVGIVAIGWFMVGLSTGWSRKSERTEADASGSAYETN